MESDILTCMQVGVSVIAIIALVVALVSMGGLLKSLVIVPAVVLCIYILGRAVIRIIDIFYE